MKRIWEIPGVPIHICLQNTQPDTACFSRLTAPHYNGVLQNSRKILEISTICDPDIRISALPDSIAVAAERKIIVGAIASIN